MDGTALAVTMRAPGHDVELAHGFLLTEVMLKTRFSPAADELVQKAAMADRVSGS